MSDARITYSQAVRLGVEYADVKPGTVRQWIARGLVIRHPDGFDPDQIILWLDTIRDVNKARGAAVASHNRYSARRSA